MEQGELSIGSTTHGRPARHGRAPGFSLVELLVILTIVGLVAGMMVPQLHMGQRQADSEMRALASTVMSAQRRAVARQTNVVVSFDVNGRYVRALVDEDGDGTSDPGEHVRTTPLGEHVVFGRGSAPAHPLGSGPVTFSKTVDGMPSVVFHRNGAASAEGGVYLTTEMATKQGDRPEDTRLLWITRATGRVSWLRYDDEDGWTREF